MNALRTGALLAWICLLWVGLWGQLTFANVLGGLAVGLGLVLLLGDRDRTHPLSGLRPRSLPALAKLVVVFVGQLVQANLRVAVEVLRPRPRLAGGILGVELAPMTDAVATLIANIITLTPGTLTLDVQHRQGERMLYIHVLSLTDAEETREQVLQLQRLVLDAFSGRSVRGEPAR